MKIVCCAVAIGLWLVSTPLQSQVRQDSSLTADTDSSQIIQPAETDPFETYLYSFIDTARTQIFYDQLGPALFDTVKNLNVRNIDSRDFLRGFGRQYGVNLLVDNRVSRQLTFQLSDVTVIEAIIQICQTNGLSLIQSGQVFRVREYQPVAAEPVREESIIRLEDDRLFMDIKELTVQEFVRLFAQETGQNIMIRNGVRGNIEGFLQDIPLEVGLSTMLSNNGFTLREKDSVFTIDRVGFRSGEGGAEGANTSSDFWVSVQDGLVSMEVSNAPIADIISELSYQSEVSIITYGLPDAQITLKTSNLTVDEVLNYLLRGTQFTFRKEKEIYVIGDKSTSGIATTKLIRLKHIRPDVALELVPQGISNNAELKVIKEQNGIMVIGTNDVIVELENFITEIDYPTPQILIETLVVDVRTSNMYELGVSLAQGAAPDSSYFNPFTLLFGQPGTDGTQSGGLLAQGSGADVNNAFLSRGNLFGIRNLGRLPRDFFFRIQALDQEGLVTIQSKPQISTLNGYTASIEVGTEQYFLLETVTPLQSPNQIITQQAQQFESIEAVVKLEITPWVSASGEVTVEIVPEFSTPVGSLDPDVPPTINKRILNSTVRLQDGETIILGGLIEESETEVVTRVPVLGRIPLLGRLFRNRFTDTEKSELVIFVTPYVFYGDGSDNARWNQIRDDMNLNIDN
ncbi:MAG: hypothetical protein AAFW89_12270 [Bacteroidota bacterium]